MDNLSLHRLIPIQWIIRDPQQPRKYFEESSINDLSNNIKQFGVLQPLLVQQNSLENFTLLCGERRLMAAQQAGLKEVPVVIYPKTNSLILSRLIQYSENIFREGLTPLETIDLIVKITNEGVSTVQLAQILGRRHDWIQGHLLANTPLYRSLFESGRLRSVAVLLIFKSLPPKAQNKLLTESGVITSTLCQKIRQHFNQSEKQRELPILSPISENENIVKQPLPVRSTITIPFNPLWLNSFNSKKELIKTIENLLNKHLLSELKQA
ncbi:ParB/RepB/Spo0J family partition protein [Ferrovum sp. PN-J185]|uniref:ParB/RepB/Spo0J family partition protein n=1 Tax=Ferrovum sp. PN-J185 TaxID=1356306 RepID=UPI00079C6DBB|nr:ParB/RepB/Spo0J family partition protein [Ferrovum sp. PN-J185]KXW56452.1 chromosome-partitioning protein Spo0J [Ferrovum sp. PN-J185]MCC6068199.1 ParB/RepB/Spo0J family partition protein [Ferrovum sp. PN-J185]MDE1891688.1 ParB/RepB/Spo0J family partition protein [Betaproteobacteria bacterium]MDE2056470.1 ParB/RepB/Spo0J family partition protein [Betaproteobacteria bacterium]